MTDKAKPEIKVLAFKEKFLKEGGKTTLKGPILKSKQDETRPGNNTPEEVRSAQRNLLACAMDADRVSGLVQYHFVATPDGMETVLDDVDDSMKDLFSMITPNTAYVTGPPNLGSMKEIGQKAGLHDYYKSDEGYRT